MMSLSDDKQADVIDAFNTASRYLDDILDIKAAYSVTMNIFRKKNFLFKSFVKAELS